MADMGFLPAVRRLIDMTSTSRQTLLFSATLDGPVDKLVRDYQHNPARHESCSRPAPSRERSHHHFWRVELRGPGGGDRRDGRRPWAGDRVLPDQARRRPALGAPRSVRTAGRRPSTATAARANARARSGRLPGRPGRRPGRHRRRGPRASTSTPCPSWSTSTRRPIHTDYVHRAGRTGRAGADGIVVSLVGPDQVAEVKLIQRKLGLPGAVSSPDLASLGTGPQMVGPAGDGARGDRARGDRTRGERARSDGARAESSSAGTRRGTSRPRRPPRRRTRRAPVG